MFAAGTEGDATRAAGQFNRYAAQSSHLLIRFVTRLGKPPSVRRALLTRQAAPFGLYLAVAQVLAYIFQLNSFKDGKGARPKNLNELPIPDELKY